MNTLIIGIGGIGEGVLAHLKLIEASSPANVAEAPSAKLLISSTLPERHYALPIAGTELSLASGSPEFSALERALQRPIDEIRAGQGPQYLLRWLTPELARVLPERIAEVSIGTGQQAVLSRATVNLEAGRILNEIRRALRRAKQSDGHTLMLVVWGAGSGGTGTGAGLEVLRLARLAADSAGNTTVIAVPVLGARGCEHLHERQREVESLYARTAGALLGAACAQSAPHAVANSLGEGLAIEARQLADLLLAIEGDQGDATAVQREPLWGLAQTTAGIITSLIEEQGALVGALPTWRTQAALVDSVSCLGSAGAASVRIDNTLIQRQAELEFARAFYEPLLRRQEGTPNAGVAQARDLIAAFPPAAMVRQVAAHEAIAWSPPAGDGSRTMAGLAAQLTDGDGKIGPLPCSPGHDVKWLVDEVPVATALRLRHVSNAQVAQSAEALIEAYLGDPATRPKRDDAWTIRGWTSASVAAVAKKFAELLDATVRSSGLDSASGLPYTVRQRPLWLLDTVEMLEELRTQIGGFKDAAQAVLGLGTPLNERRASQLDAKRSRLLGSPRSADLQRDYLRFAQDQLDLHVWHALLEGWTQVADAWLGEINRWLAIMGRATGWLAHLRDQDDDVRSSAEVLLAGRRKLGSAANHRYMPRIGGAGETALLRQLVAGSGAVEALQEQCRFAWHAERDGSHLLLLEGIPRAPERDREVVVRRLTQSGQSVPADYKLATHVSADAVSYAAESLTEDCRALTVWDGMAYEFSHVVLPAAEREHRLADQADWAREVVDALLQGAVPELGLDGEATDGVFIERFAWGPLTGSGSHERAAEMARAAASHLEQGTFTITDTPNGSVLRAFTVLLRVPFDACRIYPALLDALRRIPAEQLGLYAPEMAVRRAEILSRVLEDRGLLKRPRALCPSAATLAADADGSDGALRLAVLGTTLDVLDTIVGAGTEEDHVGLIEAGRVLADFCLVGDWVGLVEGLRARGNERAVADVQARIDVAIAGRRRGKSASPQWLANRIVQEAERIWAATADATDRFKRDVHLLFYAEALSLADALAAKSAKASGE
jgi:hypothetical protein